MLDLVRKHKIQVLDHGQRGNMEEGFLVHAIADESDIERLRDAGYVVEQHEDVDENGRARQKEVGAGNRYKKSGRADLPPHADKTDPPSRES